MNKKAFLLSLLMLSTPFVAVATDFVFKDVKDFRSMEEFEFSKDFDMLVSEYKNSCMEKWGGSSGKAQDCLNTEYEVWDRELNFYYKKLYKLLDKNGKKDLKISQKSWLKNRDLDSNFIYSLLYKATENKDGSMYIVIRAQIGNEALLGSIKHRVITLKEWVPIVKNIKNIGLAED